MRIRFTQVQSNIKGILDIERILTRNLKAGMEGLGRRLRTSSISRMRQNTKESVRSLRVSVTGSQLDLHLDVYSNLIQAAVDAYGLNKGILPDTRTGGRLHHWARTKYDPAVVLEKRGTRKNPRRVRPVGRPRKTVKFLVRPVKTAKANGPKTKRQVLVERSVKRFTYLAARAIYDKGIKPSYWNSKALEANKSRIMLDINNAITRAVTEINRG